MAEMFATKPHGYRRRGQANMYVMGRSVNTSPDKNTIELTESPAENGTILVVKIYCEAQVLCTST